MWVLFVLSFVLSVLNSPFVHIFFICVINVYIRFLALSRVNQISLTRTVNVCARLCGRIQGYLSPAPWHRDAVVEHFTRDFFRPRSHRVSFYIRRYFYTLNTSVILLLVSAGFVWWSTTSQQSKLDNKMRVQYKGVGWRQQCKDSYWVAQWRDETWHAITVKSSQGC